MQMFLVKGSIRLCRTFASKETYQAMTRTLATVYMVWYVFFFIHAQLPTEERRFLTLLCCLCMFLLSCYAVKLHNSNYECSSTLEQHMSL